MHPCQKLPLLNARNHVLLTSLLLLLPSMTNCKHQHPLDTASLIPKGWGTPADVPPLNLAHASKKTCKDKTQSATSPVFMRFFTMTNQLFLFCVSESTKQTKSCHLLTMLLPALMIPHRKMNLMMTMSISVMTQTMILLPNMTTSLLSTILMMMIILFTKMTTLLTPLMAASPRTSSSMNMMMIAPCHLLVLPPTNLLIFPSHPHIISSLLLKLTACATDGEAFVLVALFCMELLLDNLYSCAQ